MKKEFLAITLKKFASGAIFVFNIYIIYSDDYNLSVVPLRL